jgi:hypothetical protein
MVHWVDDVQKGEERCRKSWELLLVGFLLIGCVRSSHGEKRKRSLSHPNRQEQREADERAKSLRGRFRASEKKWQSLKMNVSLVNRPLSTYKLPGGFSVERGFL